ncbi:MAG: hypothetical protein KUG51_03630, partial [Urechidicola sp.]|nr:hypothetical protein [Urechidicola sp.]
GSLALAGVPIFAGFYSKDIILESAFAAHTGVGLYAYWAGIGAAIMTAFYSWRLLFLTFHGKTITITTDAKIALLNNELLIVTNFETAIDNFDIKLSKTVLNKVAKTVDVSVNLKLNPKK